MVGQLVFVRHGVAEQRSITGRNETRVLTENGRRKIHRIAPGLQKLLDPSVSWRIMTSPLPRAAQTAALLAGKLKLTMVSMPALAEGDWALVVRELSILSANEGVILVGHQPFLGEWSEIMSGFSLVCSAGGINQAGSGGVKDDGCV